MKKQEFLSEIAGRLSGLSMEDIDRSLEFYAEMIDDRIEEGLSEEDAVAAVGSVEEIVTQIRASFPAPGGGIGHGGSGGAAEEGSAAQNANSVPQGANAGSEAPRARRPMQWWVILLLVLGAPVWLPLLLALCSVILALCITVLSLVIAVFAVEIGFGAGAVGGLAASVAQLIAGQTAQALLLFGGGLVCLGLAILLFFGIEQILKGLRALCKWGFGAIRRSFTRKETAK